MHLQHQHRLSQQCEQRGLAVSALQQALLLQYLGLLLHWRPQLSLTGLRDAERMLDVLIIESLDFCAGAYLQPGQRVLDLGTGAGVPGIPLAICCPELQMTLLDRATKKVAFLQRVVADLPVPNAHPLCGNAEELRARRLLAEPFDVIVSRGVGTIAHLMHVTAPLLKPGGWLLTRKPPQTEELAAAAGLCAPGRWSQIRTQPLPWGEVPWVLVATQRAQHV